MGWLAEWVLSSSLVQGLVTLALVGVVVVLAAMGKEIPSEIRDALMLVLGFWFGTKSAQEAQRLGAKIKSQEKGGK
jgi:hypothetical protein